MTGAVFELDGPGFVASELARGPWDPNAQHGGAPAALLVRAFERLGLPPEQMLARVTYEFVRAVPLGALSVSAGVARHGRRVSLVEGSVLSGDNAELVRARGLYVHRTDVEESVVSSPVPGPQAGAANDLRPDPKRRAFATHAMDIRFVAGKFWELGPATAWFRLRVPLVAGEDPSPLQRLAAAADFGNGISAIVPWKDHLFINPDLTLYLVREPRGEWICVDARTWVSTGGVGMAKGVLRDEEGFVGSATQALLVARAAAT
jgi:Thioesterase-like superfamily